MALPIKLSHQPRFWRSNPGFIRIRCWQDRDQTIPLDLTQFGSTWAAQARQSYSDVLAAEFAVDTSQAVTGNLVLSLNGSVTNSLSAAYYVYDVEVTGGSVSPLTVFLGSFTVEGDVTRPESVIQ